MKPLREDPATSPKLARLLEAARVEREPTALEQAAVWRRVHETMDARRVQRRSPFLLAVPALAVFVATLWIGPKILDRLSPRGAVGSPLAALHVEPGANAHFTLSAGSLALQSGSVRAAPGAHVVTPQVDLRVQSAHCIIQVAGAVTTLDVLDGEVRLREGAGPEIALSGPVRWQSGASRAPASSAAIPSAPTPNAQPPIAASHPSAPLAAIPADPCVDRALDSKRACYAHIATGSDLAAQNAAYLLGQLDRTAHDLPAAIGDWADYERRFPEGALWPEAAEGILTSQLERNSWRAALDSAEEYLAHVPPGARAPEVALIRANLLREHLARIPDALAAYRALAASDAPAAVRGEALFGEALAARQLGLIGEAHAALDSYTREFPSGPHAAEAAQLRAP